MEVTSIKEYRLGKIGCYGCDTILEFSTIRRAELSNGSYVLLCPACSSRISKICQIETEIVTKPDEDECLKCIIRYKCYTNRDSKSTSTPPIF